ncbi:MAG: hypothetical protein DRQ88_06630 [Epsilonproteobacteria bacterium]|nr:MAG: hypothetical protein DRQ89_11415 [Campylobacterota bacterium]RLA66389.1 MAG: hypothetical protein DRQ88_06630 [Campylobacterota bacterium]
MLRVAIIFLTILAPFATPSQEHIREYFKGSVITDPTKTRRCEELIEHRGKKITFKNNLLGLIDRNKKLRKMVPREKVTVHEKLERNIINLKRELKLARIKIKKASEEVIIKGCPGISL